MIIEDSGLNGLRSELRYLDEVTAKLGFVRWQWENYRATYDLEHDDDYMLRINARVTEGKMESPIAVLEIRDVYVGKRTYPDGIDYDAEFPADVMRTLTEKLRKLKEALT